MRKLIALLVAVCTIFTLATTAFAGIDTTAEAHKMTEFNCDGKLDEWNTESPMVLNDAMQVVRDVVFWNGPDDLSAVFYAGWDEEYFYLAADITEDSPFGAIEMLPFDGEDNIELFISTDPNADPERTEYGSNDFLVYLVMDGEYWDTGVDRSMVPKDNRMKYVSQGLDGQENFNTWYGDGAYECAAQQTATGLTYECRIKWEVFTSKRSSLELYTPQAGDTINFDVLVTDISYPCPGTEYIPQIAWTGTANILVNPSEWGRLTFVE